MSFYLFVANSILKQNLSKKLENNVSPNVSHLFLCGHKATLPSVTREAKWCCGRESWQMLGLKAWGFRVRKEKGNAPLMPSEFLSSFLNVVREILITWGFGHLNYIF